MRHESIAAGLELEYVDGNIHSSLKDPTWIRKMVSASKLHDLHSRYPISDRNHCQRMRLDKIYKQRCLPESRRKKSLISCKPIKRSLVKAMKRKATISQNGDIYQKYQTDSSKPERWIRWLLSNYNGRLQDHLVSKYKQRVRMWWMSFKTPTFPIPDHQKATPPPRNPCGDDSQSIYLPRPDNQIPQFEKDYPDLFVVSWSKITASTKTPWKPPIDHRQEYKAAAQKVVGLSNLKRLNRMRCQGEFW